MQLDEPELTLTVNGQMYAGWETVDVRRSIDCLAGAFELTVSDRWSRQDAPWPIVEGNECTIAIGGEVLITGKVDRRAPTFNARERQLVVAGRDKTGDLVDCSYKPRDGAWEFQQQSVEKIVRKVCDPFGVTVSVASGLTLPTRDKFAINYGDTAFDVIDKACRLAGVLAVADGKGGLLLTRTPAGQATSGLAQGVNILAASGQYDESGRYHTYWASGQSPGNDEHWGPTIAGPEAKATDDNVRAVRVLLLHMESNANLQQCQDRANWEAAVRAARAGRATVQVQGWTQADGSLWPLNATVSLQSDWLGIDSDMVIAGVRFTKNLNEGTLTTLDLARPDAYLPEPVVPAGTDRWNEIPDDLPDAEET